jgi:hypothetical protein
MVGWSLPEWSTLKELHSNGRLALPKILGLGGSEWLRQTDTLSYDNVAAVTAVTFYSAAGANVIRHFTAVIFEYLKIARVLAP